MTIFGFFSRRPGSFGSPKGFSASFEHALASEHAHSSRTASSSRKGRRLAVLGATAGTLALLLSSCASGVRFDSRGASLPELTEVDTLRETAARTEAAAWARASSLAEDASSCPECAQALSLVAANSQARLNALGGVWSPWGDHTPEGAEEVPPVADAPVTVEELVSWLASTAHRDLAAAADPTLMESDNSRALASVALGRYRSALDLAGAFNVSLDSEAAAVTEFNARLHSFISSQTMDLLSGWGLDPQALSAASILPDADLSAAQSLAESTELAEAVASWDCTAQSLPKAQLVEFSIADAELRSHELFSRVDHYLSAGANDHRTTRCILDSLDAPSLANGLLLADLHLLSSDDRTIRLIGLHEALEDLSSWSFLNEYGTSPALIGASA